MTSCEKWFEISVRYFEASFMANISSLLATKEVRSRTRLRICTKKAQLKVAFTLLKTEALVQKSSEEETATVITVNTRVMGSANMSEWEKMISGELYRSSDPDLLKHRARTKRLFLEYNNNVGYSEDMSLRHKHIAELFGSVGKNTWIEPPIRVDYGTNIHVGDKFYCNFDVVILDSAEIRIGNNVLIAPGVHIYSATHPMDSETRHHALLELAKPVSIGSDVWIGGRAVILPGVSIGDKCVIGAGAVITKDVPPNSLVVGNPGRVIRKLD